jgi:hypothetical protein
MPLSASVTVAGERLIESSTGGGVIVAAEDVTDPNFALIVMAFCPVATTVARPELLMLTFAELDEVHVVIVDVMFAVVPLLYVPVAVYCWVPPRGSGTLAGDRLMDFRVVAAAA